MALPSDRLVGSDLVVIFRPSGTTNDLTLSGDQTAFSTNRSQDNVDVTAGNEKNRYFKGTIENLEWTLSIFDAEQSYLANILPGKEGKLTIYKKGVGAGKPVMSFNVLIGGYNEDFPFDGALEIELSGVRLGAMIDEQGTVQA